MPQKLTPDANGNVPCLILVTLPAGDCTGPGLADVDPTLLARFRQSQHDTWTVNGRPGTDPSLLPTCQLTELTPSVNTKSFDANGSCAASSDSGWCYVEGKAAGSCPQSIIFTAGEPPPGAQVSLQCIEQANGVVGDGG